MKCPVMTSGVAPRASIACTLSMEPDSRDDSQATLDTFAADATAADREALEARVDQNARDIEYLIEHAEKLTEQLDRALGDDGGAVDAAGDGDRIDTPDGSRAHRGYE